MNRALSTSFVSIASLAALTLAPATASAQNFGQPPPASSYSASYTSTGGQPRAYTSANVVTAPPGQRAGAPASDFGNQGNLSIGSDFNFNFSVLAPNAGNTTVDFALLPAADYFIIQNLSLGGAAGIAYSHTDPIHTFDFRLSPRVGYNIPVADNFSVWPRVGFQFDYVDSGTSAASNSGAGFGINVSVPLLWHPHEHYYLGVSPNLTAEFAGDGKFTSAGLNFIVGGWL